MFDGADGPWLLLTGAMLIVTAWLLWRGGRRRRANDGDRADRVRRAADLLQRGNGDRLREMELRLYETSRDVEASIETRLRMLDELVDEADREIGRLEAAIEEARGRADGADAEPLRTVPFERGSREERRLAGLLHDAGYTASEIACILDVTEETVVDLLDEDVPPARAA